MRRRGDGRLGAHHHHQPVRRGRGLHDRAARGHRLASNSLLEALVFSHQAAQVARETLPDLLAKPATPVAAWDTYGPRTARKG